MQLLRTWSVENAAVAVADQNRIPVESLPVEMLSAFGDRRVTPEEVNAWLEFHEYPYRWRVEPHLKYRDTSEVSRYLQGGKEPAEIAAIMGWPVEDVQAVMKAQGG